MLNPLIQLRFLALFILFSFTGNAQLTLNGWVIDKDAHKVVPETHVINKSTLKGTLTDFNGYFELSIELGDTIVFSNIAYKYFYFVYNQPEQKLDSVLIYMEEQNYLLNEVSVFAYELTTNDPKEMRLEKPMIPDNSTLREERLIQATIQNPAEYLYNLFGSKPRELRKLAALKEADAYRHKLEESNNRQSVITLTGLEEQDLEAFMFYCKYSSVYIRTINDYEYLKSLQRCYREYIREKELNSFLEQFD